jgi:hypothetical protein
MAQVKEHHEDILSYTFLGDEVFVDSGREALIMISDTMRRENEAVFTRLPAEICYRDKRWFARSQEGMHSPHRFLGSDIYVDLNLKTKDIKKIAYDIIALFGFWWSRSSARSRS